MGDSFRAGGIHWAATMDAGGFAKGARQVKTEAERLKRELAAIQASDLSNFNKAMATKRVYENYGEREKEHKRFNQQTADNMKAAADAMAGYERQAKAVSVANVQQAMTFRQLNDHIKGVLGRGSAFKDILEIAAGGGAIAGLSMITNAFGAMGRSLSEVAAASLAAGTNMNDMASKFVSSIPIIGGVHDAAKGVYDILDVAFRGDDADVNQKARFERRERRRLDTFGFQDKLRFDRQDLDLAWFRDQDDATNIEAIGRKYKSLKEQVTIDLDRFLEEVGAKIGFGTTAYTQIYKDAQTNKEIRNSLLDRALELELKKYKESVGRALIESAAKQIETVKKFVGDTGGGILGGLGEVGKAMGARAEQDRDRIRQRAIRRAEADMKRQDDFIGGARGFFDRLRDIENAPVRFGAALEVGSQAEFEARQKAIFGGTVSRQDEKELAKKAVELQKQEVEQGRAVLRLLKDAMKELGVTDFGGN